VQRIDLSHHVGGLEHTALGLHRACAVRRALGSARQRAHRSSALHADHLLQANAVTGVETVSARAPRRAEPEHEATSSHTPFGCDGDHSVGGVRDALHDERLRLRAVLVERDMAAHGRMRCGEVGGQARAAWTHSGLKSEKTVAFAPLVWA
jgi:hypothetical protein